MYSSERNKCLVLPIHCWVSKGETAILPMSGLKYILIGDVLFGIIERDLSSQETRKSNDDP